MAGSRPPGAGPTAHPRRPDTPGGLTRRLHAGSCPSQDRQGSRGRLLSVEAAFPIRWAPAVWVSCRTMKSTVTSVFSSSRGIGTKCKDCDASRAKHPGGHIEASRKVRSDHWSLSLDHAVTYGDGSLDRRLGVRFKSGNSHVDANAPGADISMGTMSTARAAALMRGGTPEKHRTMPSAAARRKRRFMLTHQTSPVRRRRARKQDQAVVRWRHAFPSSVELPQAAVCLLRSSSARSRAVSHPAPYASS
jgi:hypothetical protein